MTSELTQTALLALRIWRAGLDAVRSDLLVRNVLRVEGDDLVIDNERLPLAGIRRILVVGAGKAGAGMASGVLEALGESVLESKQVTGWVNVPEDCVRPLARIHLHAARPPSLNEPTEAGVAGSEKILKLVAELTPQDLVLCLISGGASALLPAPVEGITLADKQEVTRHLSTAGANIAELNAVRKPLSRIKGGGLARACKAGRLVTLIISDVMGDPLSVIGSGPTVSEQPDPRQALEILERYGAREAGISPRVFDVLTATQPVARSEGCDVTNLVIGNNALAVNAAGAEAERLGLAHALVSATALEGPAEDVGRHLARMALAMQTGAGPPCLVTGGEPTVKLAPAEIRGRGGRSQQLALAALVELSHRSQSSDEQSVIACGGLAIAAGGTDGEDGPTDAAGAVVDELVAQRATRLGLDAADFLRRSDAYTFFDSAGGLIRTGPTHTNVGDLRVVLVERAGG